MQIKKITVEYKELRSTGYPNFSNQTYGIAYEAEITEDQNPDECRRELMQRVIKEVKQLHGERFDGKVVKISVVPEKQETLW